MAKQSKTEQALEKKSIPEIKKAVMCDNQISIKAKNIFKNADIRLPEPMCFTSLNGCDKIISLKMALRNSDLHEELINDIMDDLITGAFQNRLEVYSISLSEGNKCSTEAFAKLQKQRQLADMHLLNIIKAIKDIKHPPVQVVVKQAEQVNVGDKQVNVANNQQSA